MTDIEKEARECVSHDMESVLLSQWGKHEGLDQLRRNIEKALQAKQDRIEELEVSLLGLKAGNKNIQDAMKKKIDELEKKTVQAIAADFYLSEFNQANEKIKELEFIIKSDVPFGTMLMNAQTKVKELEHLLHGHSDEVLRTCYQKIKTLEDALKPFIENYDKYGNHGPFAHGLFERAKKAIGGGNDNATHE